MLLLNRRAVPLLIRCAGGHMVLILYFMIMIWSREKIMRWMLLFTSIAMVCIITIDL